MRLTPIAWRYTFPGAKATRPSEAQVFKAKQICGFSQLQYRVGGNIAPSGVELPPAPAGSWNRIPASGVAACEGWRALESLARRSAVFDGIRRCQKRSFMNVIRGETNWRKQM